MESKDATIYQVTVVLGSIRNWMKSSIIIICSYGYTNNHVYR